MKERMRTDATLYAGIAWSAAGYEAEIVDGDGRAVTPPVRFGAARTDEMIAYLRGVDRVVAVVDSTNGVLDGRLMAAGLAVRRADPWLLPERPAFGSVPAGALARAACRNPSLLAPLERGRGTQTGREAELDRWIAASAADDEALTASGRCLAHGPRDRREIALTFDDGPLPPYTGQILDILERYGVPATFFCVGMNSGPHAEDLARMREQGHGLGNHTWSHPFLPELSRPQLAEQIDRTQEAIALAGGGRAPTLMRPPYGSRTPAVLGWLAELVRTTVLWDVAPDDWAMPGAEAIARSVLDGARPGSIVLLHDGGGDRAQTVAALPPIIEGLLARGFRFVLVEDMVPAAGHADRREQARSGARRALANYGKL
ncbi:MAG TPA: polysaccharide deacetylase family protein [Streptosporangiaceae bacterium]